MKATMNILYKNVDDLIPYDKNTKKHDKKQIKNVATSIKKYGFVQPLVIDKNDVVVIGHCRLLGAKELKMDTVPCVCVDDLTEEQVNALRIVDNKTNESEWNMDILPDELLEVDLGEFEFDFNCADTFDDTFDENDLDDGTEKSRVVVSLNIASVDDYEYVKEKLQNIADEIGATVAVKMA